MGCITFRIDGDGTDAILHSIPTDRVLKVTEAIRVLNQVFFKTADGRCYSTVVPPTSNIHYSCGDWFHRVGTTLKAMGKLGLLNNKQVAKYLKERAAQIEREEAQRNFQHLKQQAETIGYKLVKTVKPKTK